MDYPGVQEQQHLGPAPRKLQEIIKQQKLLLFLFCMNLLLSFAALSMTAFAPGDSPYIILMEMVIESIHYIETPRLGEHLSPKRTDERSTDHAVPILCDTGTCGIWCGVWCCSIFCCKSKVVALLLYFQEIVHVLDSLARHLLRSDRARNY